MKPADQRRWPNSGTPQGLRERYNDLRTERQLVAGQIAELDTQDKAAPSAPNGADLDLLDALRT
ncbi:MAG TPA: hypothetical protein VFO16_09310 [Pseudonocardiaceae bacterium]|nr:hypothetical protein [Pseudonocardiaceae bacterium]